MMNKCICGNIVEQFRVDVLNSKICSSCAMKRATPRHKGITIWSHKTAPVLQVVSEETHSQFYRDTYRKGQMSILRLKAPAGGRLV